jgi:hypothetical protein
VGAVNGIESTEPGAPSHILREPFSSSTSVGDTAAQGDNLFALAKMCMPKLAELFLQFKEEDETGLLGRPYQRTLS